MHFKRVLAACLVMVFGFCSPVYAQSIMKQCSEAYRAVKAANQLNGQTWPQFLSHCSEEKSTQTETPAAAVQTNPPPASPATAPTQPSVSATTTSAPPAATTPAAGSTIATAAGGSRQKQCGSEWRANKDTLKAQYGTWPKFWSACNKRMKAEGK